MLRELRARPSSSASRCRPRRSPRGKPAPDVYLEAARRLGVDARRCAAVEDSASGIRAAYAAGMRVIAYPNRHYPPPPEALALADHVLSGLEALTPELLTGDAVRP